MFPILFILPDFFYVSSLSSMYWLLVRCLWLTICCHKIFNNSIWYPFKNISNFNVVLILIWTWQTNREPCRISSFSVCFWKIYKTFPNGVTWIKLQIFLNDIINQPKYINFTMELQSNPCLPFLDVKVSPQLNGRQRQSVPIISPLKRSQQ